MLSLFRGTKKAIVHSRPKTAYATKFETSLEICTCRFRNYSPLNRWSSVTRTCSAPLEPASDSLSAAQRRAQRPRSRRRPAALSGCRPARSGRSTATPVQHRSVCPERRAVPSMPLAPPLRSRGAAAIMVRLFGVWNRPNPAPATAIRHATSNNEGWGGSHAERAEAEREQQEADATEKPGRIALHQPSGEWRRKGNRDRPGRDQKPDLDGRISEAVFEIEGQRDEGQHLRAERRDRGRNRQGENRNAQQIQRQQRRFHMSLRAHQQEARDRRAAKFRQRNRRTFVMADAVDRGEAEPKGGGAERCAHPVEVVARGFGVRQIFDADQPARRDRAEC